MNSCSRRCGSKLESLPRSTASGPLGLQTSESRRPATSSRRRPGPRCHPGCNRGREPLLTYLGVRELDGNRAVRGLTVQLKLVNRRRVESVDTEVRLTFVHIGRVNVVY